MKAAASSEPYAHLAHCKHEHVGPGFSLGLSKLARICHTPC